MCPLWVADERVHSGGVWLPAQTCHVGFRWSGGMRGAGGQTDSSLLGRGAATAFLLFSELLFKIILLLLLLLLSLFFWTFFPWLSHFPSSLSLFWPAHLSFLYSIRGKRKILECNKTSTQTRRVRRSKAHYMCCCCPGPSFLPSVCVCVCVCCLRM